MRKALALSLALALASCGEIPRPFAPEFKGETNALLMPVDRAGIVVKPVTGLEASGEFTAALVERLRGEGIAAMQGAGNSASLVLRGSAKPDGDGWLVELALDDPHGRALGIVATWVPREPTAAHASAVAKSVAAVLHPEGPLPVARKPAVVVGEVAGVPGDGGRALARALEFNLRRANVELADLPEKATHVVTATVIIARPKGQPGKELRHVDVRWTVRGADNREIGQVRQTNDVPARDIDRNWSEIAYVVADAAVDGIADLLSRPAAP